MDSSICFMLFSVLGVWLWLGLGLGLTASWSELVLIWLQFGWGRKIASVMYICPSQTENNAEFPVLPQYEKSIAIIWLSCQHHSHFTCNSMSQSLAVTEIFLLCEPIVT